ncbi:hypothetical protein F4861DRAFT_551384 [Xylaria intraflava]|nr:hypothetical protein F4861DRAFT_551384 [Xylaria intraflava]
MPSPQEPQQQAPMEMSSLSGTGIITQQPNQNLRDGEGEDQDDDTQRFSDGRDQCNALCHPFSIRRILGLSSGPSASTSSDSEPLAPTDEEQPSQRTQSQMIPAEPSSRSQGYERAPSVPSSQSRMIPGSASSSDLQSFEQSPFASSSRHNVDHSVIVGSNQVCELHRYHSSNISAFTAIGKGKDKACGGQTNSKIVIKDKGKGRQASSSSPSSSSSSAHKPVKEPPAMPGGAGPTVDGGLAADNPVEFGGAAWEPDGDFGSQLARVPSHDTDPQPAKKSRRKGFKFVGGLSTIAEEEPPAPK